MNPLDSNKTTNTPIFSPALEYGALLSIIGMIIMVTSYYLHLAPDSGLNKAFSWVIPIVGVFWFIWHYKSKRNSQILEFGTGIKLSALTGLITGLLSGIGSLIFMQWIAPDYSKVILESSIRTLQKQGQSEEVIQQSLPIMEFFSMPITIAGMVLIMTVISYTIIGLVATAIMKKDQI